MNPRKESLGKEAVVSCVDVEGPNRTGAKQDSGLWSCQDGHCWWVSRVCGNGSPFGMGSKKVAMEMTNNSF